MEFIQCSDTSKKCEVIDGMDEMESVDSLKSSGFKVEACTILHDGSGVAYFLVMEGGKEKWFPLRYD